MMRREAEHRREFYVHLMKAVIGALLGLVFGIWLPETLAAFGWLVILAIAFALALFTRVALRERSFLKCFFMYGTLSYVLAAFLCWGIAYTYLRVT